MTPQEAARAVNEAAFHPDWELHATAVGNRVIVSVRLSTWDSSDIDQRGTYWNKVKILPEPFAFDVDGEMAEEDVLFQVVKGIDKINAHETREFLRTRRNGRWVAPFHPHRWDGEMLNEAMSRAYRQEAGK